MTTPIQRLHDYGPDLNYLLDLMLKRMDGIVTGTVVILHQTGAGGGGGSGGRVAPGRSDRVALPVINTTGETFLAGYLLGIAPGGDWALAQAGSVKATTVCTQASPPNSIVHHASTGVQAVYVEAGVSLAKGAPVYLSATDPGTVTSVEGQWVQVIGESVDVKDGTGMAPVILHLELSTTRST